jgi:hypothetical protein
MMMPENQRCRVRTAIFSFESRRDCRPAVPETNEFVILSDRAGSIYSYNPSSAGWRLRFSGSTMNSFSDCSMVMSDDILAALGIPSLVRPTARLLRRRQGLSVPTTAEAIPAYSKAYAGAPDRACAHAPARQ